MSWQRSSFVCFNVAAATFAVAAWVACGSDTGSDGAAGAGGGVVECQLPLELCDGVCVHSPSDPENCGSCGNACDPNQVCIAGACECDPGLVACADGCQDLSNDPDHCGDCAIACLAGQTCASGVCSDCPANTVACANEGVCADIASDEANCGGCGVDCGGGTCTTGICSCVGSTTSCPDGCYDTQTDEAHCGSCAISCLQGQTCTAGVCGDCPATQVACVFQGTCADLSSDPDNCGQCGLTCGPGGTCQSGVCVCQPNNVDCGPIFGCVNLASDPDHCGGCGSHCPVDASCISGACHCNGASELACGNNCVDVSVDPNHCGSCGNDCDPIYGTCGSGVCGCVGGLKACGQNHTCTDVAEDPRNCGQCGSTCGDREACVDGSCECLPGLVLVQGQCVDPASDPQHCGPNLVTCGGNTPLCDNGQCVATCNLPDNCNGACVDQDWDPLHCGGCNNACASDEVCVQGNCRPWRVGVGCNTCPCNISCVGDFDQCCLYPGVPSLVACVDANTCPQ